MISSFVEDRFFDEIPPILRPEEIMISVTA
jgi:hypothetical protein